MTNSIENENKPTVVLVHGAWADGSSWNKVSARLLKQGLKVVAAQLPMTSLADDVATLQRTLRSQQGPIVLVGHSYGGAVITVAAADNRQVRALVYIAAIVPAAGQTVGEVFGRHPAQAPALTPNADGMLWVDEAVFRMAAAPDATAEEQALLAVAQQPIGAVCLGEPAAVAAWKTIPSWFMVAERDRMVSPQTQRETAAMIGAHTTSRPVDHWPLLSSPDSVADLIGEGVTAAQNRTY